MAKRIGRQALLESRTRMPVHPAGLIRRQLTSQPIASDDIPPWISLSSRTTSSWGSSSTPSNGLVDNSKSFKVFRLSLRRRLDGGDWSFLSPSMGLSSSIPRLTRRRRTISQFRIVAISLSLSLSCWLSMLFWIGRWGYIIGDFEWRFWGVQIRMRSRKNDDSDYEFWEWGVTAWFRCSSTKAYLLFLKWSRIACSIIICAHLLSLLKNL